MKVAIFGASGFVGQHLLRHILKTTDYQVRALSRHPETIKLDARYASRVERMACDVFDPQDVAKSLAGIDVAVYLLHMMARKGDYFTFEAEAAESFGKAVQAANTRRVVFLGGLGNDADKLSKHLASRHNTGKILRQYAPLVLELRAAMVIGDGSVGYDIIKNLVHRLPVQTLPKWATTKTQPIYLNDALAYLTASLTVPLQSHEIVEIGGPEQLTYRDMVAGYAAAAGKKPILITIPFVPLWLGAWWIDMFTPGKHHAKVGRQMVESLANPMVVTDDKAAQLFPAIKPQPISKAFFKTVQP